MQMEQPSRNQAATAILLLVISALAVGLMPILSKIAFQNGSNPETVMVIRSAVGAAIIGVYIVLVQARLGIPKRLFVVAVLACLSGALMAYTSMKSLLYLDVGLSMLILFAHPFLVAFYFHHTGATLLTPVRLAWSVLAFAGLALALSVDFSKLSMFGIALAVASALLATVMIIAMASVNKEVGGPTTSFHVALWSLVLFTVVLLASRRMQLPANQLGWLSAVGTGLLFAIVYVAFLIAFRLIGPSRATALSFLEPITAILFAAVIFGERLSLLQWGGVALVVFGLFMLEAPLGQRQVKREAVE
jgi:drug/metabolite transporter (DMT)-like permease